MILGGLFISGLHSAQNFNFCGINIPKDKLSISDWIAGHQEPFGLLLMKLPRG